MNEFYWTDGYTVDFANWGADWAFNIDNSNQQCGFIQPADGTWNVQKTSDCQFKRPFICKISQGFINLIKFS